MPIPVLGYRSGVWLLPWFVVGGAVGALSRFLVLELCSRRFGWPAWATLIGVNVLGSFAIGCAAAEIASPGSAWVARLAELAAADPASVRSVLSALILTGLCGGFTTFSSYELHGYVLLRGRRHQLFLLQFLGTPLLAFSAAALGWGLFA
ncbi:MAG: CrcB family protein [bacterium]|nr:CrcB family protein [bacterium]MDP7572182.1 CrcB family protein [Myxococcota bacterium]